MWCADCRRAERTGKELGESDSDRGCTCWEFQDRKWGCNGVEGYADADANADELDSLFFLGLFCKQTLVPGYMGLDQNSDTSYLIR